MKKLLGILLILLAILLIVPTIQGLYKVLLLPHSSGYETGYQIGYLGMQVLFAFVIYFLFKRGAKLLSQKSK